MEEREELEALSAGCGSADLTALDMDTDMLSQWAGELPGGRWMSSLDA